ncbi:MAG TPA: hypothetical protein VHK27_02835 [Gammaproteobacteria bacterium]|nr:hypothetical protein [Gammaproteobacteria bacterium]
MTETLLAGRDHTKEAIGKNHERWACRPTVNPFHRHRLKLGQPSATLRDLLP